MAETEETGTRSWTNSFVVKYIDHPTTTKFGRKCRISFLDSNIEIMKDKHWTSDLVVENVKKT